MLFVIIFATMSVVCLVYYFAMITYAGVGTAFAPAWIIAFLFFGISAVVGLLNHRGVINLPVAVKRGYFIFVGFCFTLFFVLEGLVISGMSSKPQKELDYIIVMGAQVKGTVPSKSLLRRIEAARDYLNENSDTIAIVTGGKGDREDITEAECMRNYLVGYGIPEERIIMEDKATNTDENIEFSMEIINELSDEENPSIGIVTNNFHVFRTLCVCDEKGYDVAGIPAESDEILFFNYMVREAFALVQYKLTGRV